MMKAFRIIFFSYFPGAGSSNQIAKGPSLPLEPNPTAEPAPEEATSSGEGQEPSSKSEPMEQDT